MSIEEEAKDLFLFFAQFEFALKNSGYVEADDRDKAKPSWTRFKTVANFAVPTGDVDILEIRNNPPRPQYYRNNVLEDGPQRQPIGTCSELIEACHTIRNNLFHGGKHNNADYERNLKLLRGAKKVLNAALEADQNVKAAFLSAHL